MAFSIFGGKQEETFIVLDIGNASVGGALVKRKIIDGEPKLEFIVNERISIPLGERIHFNRLLKTMLQAVEAVSKQLIKKIDRNKIPVYVILASPWYVSETKIVNIKKDKPFPLTKELEQEVLSKELLDFKESLAKRNTKGYEKTLVVIESKVINVTLNGYDTREPIGKSAENVRLALYISISNQKVIEMLTDKLHKYFSGGNITFHSFPLAYFSMVRDLYPGKRDFLLVDISGEVTDVSLIKHAILMETNSFPFGRNFLLRQIASGFRRTIEEAESLLSLYSNNSLSSVENEKLKKIINDSMGKWLKEFQDALVDLSGKLYVPGDIFLASDGDVSELFTSSMGEEQFSQYSLTHEKFNVIPLSMASSMNLPSKAEPMRDEFLNIAALFVGKIIDPVK